MYELGQELHQFGSVYVVEDLYELSDDEMRQYSLVFKRRVTLRKVSGEHGLERYDFAVTL